MPRTGIEFVFSFFVVSFPQEDFARKSLCDPFLSLLISLDSSFDYELLNFDGKISKTAEKNQCVMYGRADTL